MRVYSHQVLFSTLYEWDNWDFGFIILGNFIGLIGDNWCYGLLIGTYTVYIISNWNEFYFPLNCRGCEYRHRSTWYRSSYRALNTQQLTWRSHEWSCTVVESILPTLRETGKQCCLPVVSDMMGDMRHTFSGLRVTTPIGKALVLCQLYNGGRLFKLTNCSIRVYQFLCLIVGLAILPLEAIP